MKKIVVTGATSFIAVHLIKKLLQNGEYVYAIVRPNSNNSYKIPKHKNIKVIELELKNIYLLPIYISENIDIIYHFAWEGIRGKDRDDCFLQESNYIATKNAIGIAKKLNTSIFVGLGSQAEYGNVNGVIDEKQLEKPTTQYGIYKLKSKMYCETFARQNNMLFYWPRIFSAYGIYDYHNSLIMSCIGKMRKNEDINLTECTQKWDYVYVEDIAVALLKFGIVKCDSGVYNIGSGEGRVLKDYVIELKQILNSKSSLKFGFVPYGLQGKVDINPKIDKINHALDWYPETSFSDGINNILNNL